MLKNSDATQNNHPVVKLTSDERFIVARNGKEELVCNSLPASNTYQQMFSAEGKAISEPIPVFPSDAPNLYSCLQMFTAEGRAISEPICIAEEKAISEPVPAFPSDAPNHDICRQMHMHIAERKAISEPVPAFPSDAPNHDICRQMHMHIAERKAISEPMPAFPSDAPNLVHAFGGSLIKSLGIEAVRQIVQRTLSSYGYSNLTISVVNQGITILMLALNGGSFALIGAQVLVRTALQYAGVSANHIDVIDNVFAAVNCPTTVTGAASFFARVAGSCVGSIITQKVAQFFIGTNHANYKTSVADTDTKADANLVFMQK
jgi:hypothetical protein